MKKLLLLNLAVISAISLHAQVITEQVDLGAGYVNQVYYGLDNQTQTTVSASSWDI